MVSSPLQIVLVGDSDISQWPEALLPKVADSEVSVSGHSGATLEQCLPHVGATVRQLFAERSQPPEKIVLIFLAGENDSMNGIPLSKSEESLKVLLGTVWEIDHSYADCAFSLIVIGPKFEPWLIDDLESRKAYVNMSRAFDRCCKEYSETTSGAVVFMDCLTLFCGESANLPGAVLGGKAVPEEKYFDKDRMHLCDEGYRRLKKVVEDQILK